MSSIIGKHTFKLKQKIFLKLKIFNFYTPSQSYKLNLKIFRYTKQTNKQNL